MKKFKVRIYRNGSWFRKLVEELEITADEYFTDRNNETNFYRNIGESKCNGSELVASFKAENYTVIRVESWT
jgi:hypothetical protein